MWSSDGYQHITIIKLKSNPYSVCVDRVGCYSNQIVVGCDDNRVYVYDVRKNSSINSPGPHRSSGGNLYQRMREIRGLNYGDYSYIEYFPGGMFQFEPDPNLYRRSQIFQIWIRPVEPPTAHFALRLGLFELERLIEKGIPEADFETTRDFLALNVNLLMKTKSAELGYLIDSKAYGIPEYTSYIQTALKKLKYEDVQKAIKKHLRKDRLQIVAISDNAEELKKQFLSDVPSPMKYNSPKPGDILEEDKIVSTKKFGWKPEQITVVPLEEIYK